MIVFQFWGMWLNNKMELNCELIIRKLLFAFLEKIEWEVRNKL